MTWVKLDDQFFRNPKSQAIGIQGRELYLAGLCYCAGQLTDGRIPKAMVPILSKEAGVRTQVVVLLVQHGMWADYGDHYHVHDWDRYNPPASKVKEERDKGAERQRQSRSRRESRRDSRVTDSDPSRPVLSDGSNEPSQARQIVNDYWDSVTPKPVTAWMGLYNLALRFLSAGHVSEDIDWAFRHSRAHTIAAMEFALSQRPRRDPEVDARRAEWQAMKAERRGAS